MRSCGSRSRNYNLGFLVQLEIIEKNNFDRYKKGQLATLEVVEDVSLPINSVKIARFSTFQSVNLSPLDLTVFDKDGVSRIDLSVKKDDLPKTLQESWKKRYEILQKEFTDYAKGIKTYNKIRVANKDIIGKSVFNGAMFSGYKINNENSLSKKGNLLEFNIRRINHYKSPYSDDLLQKFMLYLSRNAFDHDFTVL